MAKVLIADDHPAVRAGLRALLKEDSGVTEIGEAASGDETLACLRSGHWDMLILDINMPGRSGLDVLRSVRESFPGTKVLVLSGFSERQYGLSSIKAGASGYLPKECAPQDLLTATRTIMKGRRYISSQMAEMLVSDPKSTSDQPLHDCLSQREFQIFAKIAAGRAVSAIGRELSLSVKTVSTYRSRILQKMNLLTNA
ncbi:MAG TPA: response regulator transcription factor, partial [Steroidobacteraceae bacterium]